MQDAVALQFHTHALRHSGAWRPVPPLLLYAALCLVLGELFAAPLFLPALLLGASVLTAAMLIPARGARALCLGAAGLSVLAFALPLVRAGGMLLINRLYAASEAVNAYAYRYLAVSAADETAAVCAALTALAAPLGALCAAAAKRRGWTLALFLSVTVLEGYFGVTPHAWKNLALFAALALLLVRGMSDAGRTAPVAALAAVILLSVLLLAPRPNAAVESYSEHLRDELEIVLSGPQPGVLPPETESNRTRRESRRHEETAQTDRNPEQPGQGFAHLTQREQQISLPHRADLLRIALLLLAVIALLVVPFFPFLLLNRAKRRAAETNAALHAADNAAAIRAMFAHLMDWLCRCGLQTENRPFVQCAEAVGALLPEGYAARYADAASIWQEAAYSDHSMTDAQRQTVDLLLHDTEAILYARAGRWMRFRLKYIDCLCEG